ncbi:hypothetical protein SSX86_024272 [Deinandra increscens subsp. villosa]|uniref:DUF641 domain-containing protein n=1 Tax=Deinandra increscens subsp. villosa TaxID=3103831 RepID=A0AAP0GQF5_9ASTR
MESLNQPTLNLPPKTRLSRAFAKVLHIQKTKSNPKVKPDKPIPAVESFDHQDENSATMDAFVARVFATVSSVKATYAQLQVAQSPYHPEGIQSADQIMVSELKRLSEFKRLFLKKHLDDDINPPETAMLLAEIQENKNLVQMYDINLKKLDSQKKLKDSEIIFLKETLNETHKENKMIERRLKLTNPNGSSFNLSSHENFNLSSHEKLNFSFLTTSNFLLCLLQATRSVKGFVEILMTEMEDANWDLNAAASSIYRHTRNSNSNSNSRHEGYECFAFESFVCGVMFDGFINPCFSMTNNNGFAPDSRFFLDSFMELKSLKSREYIKRKPNSIFAKFCYSKYTKLVHPVMETSLFNNLNQRNLASAGKFPETDFFAAYADVARRVWLLHCLAFSFDEKPSIFQVGKGSRFTEVYMQSVNEEPSPESAPETSPEVGFTVVPGFKVGGTVIQCQVYLT